MKPLKKREREEKNKNVLNFLMISIAFLVFESIVVGVIAYYLPSTIMLFGIIPFSMTAFVFGIFIVSIIVLGVEFFPRTSKKINNQRRID